MFSLIHTHHSLSINIPEKPVQTILHFTAAKDNVAVVPTEIETS